MHPPRSHNAAGILTVPDEATARKARTILVREDLTPSNVSPWNLFDTERWTTTDFERNVNLLRSITSQVTQHIESLEEVDRANVVITMPERTLFASDQNPTTASVIIYQRPGSDILTNKNRLAGLVDHDIPLVADDLAGAPAAVLRQPEIVRLVGHAERHHVLVVDGVRVAVGNVGAVRDRAAVGGQDRPVAEAGMFALQVAGQAHDCRPDLRRPAPASRARGPASAHVRRRSAKLKVLTGEYTCSCLTPPAWGVRQGSAR